MSKQYGLIIPGEKKKTAPILDAKKPLSVFGESSSSDSDDGPPQLKSKKPSISMGPGNMERRIARQMQEKALKEDPTVFQYDEVYDEMENKKDTEKTVKAQEPRKPKYINKLLETAERRKLENELRVERQVQKEREQEGEEFKDKESFVTSAYRKKLEEMRKLQEEHKRDEYLEAIGDVTKQKNIDGFYRHLYEQKLGTSKDIKKPELELVTTGGDEEISYKPIKSINAPKEKQRAYRKRHSSEEEDHEDENILTSQKLKQKVHLQNNMDADSDFSIDSSSSEDENDKEDNESKNKKENPTTDSDKKVTSEINSLDCTNKNNIDTKDINVKTELNEVKTENRKDEMDENVTSPKPKKKKKENIWEKRTIGAVFDDAVRRYFERKAAKRA